VRLLSIVIPTHNRSERLLGNLGPITKICDQRLEVIIVDDGSCPAHRDRLTAADIARDDVMLITHSTARGAPAARNTGFHKSTGTWIWFLDDDEAVTPDTVLALLDILENGQLKCLVFLCAQNCYADRVVKVTPKGADLFAHLRRYGQEVNTSCAIIDRDLLIRVGLWDEGLVAGQDTDLFLRLSQLTDATVLEHLSVDVQILPLEAGTRQAERTSNAVRSRC